MNHRTLYYPLCLALLLSSCTSPSSEEDLSYTPPRGDFQQQTSITSEGQIVYVPAYSHIYHQDGKPHPLTVTLSIRNTSRISEIIINSVVYYDSKGKKLRNYLDNPLRLSPLATTAFLVERSDVSGGVGASFIVEWNSSDATTPPLIETVMIDTSGQQGLSFARTGKKIFEEKAQ